MRENNFSKKGLGKYYSQFRIKKNLISTALNALKSAGVSVFDVRVEDKGYAYFSALNKDEKKVFAIIKELWYNEKVVVKTASYGFLYPIYRLFANIGLFIGIIAFALTAYFNSFIITDFYFSGSGKEYKREVTAFLNANGVYEYKSIKGVDLGKIKNDILASNPNLSFVEIKKDGFRLIVELELATDKKPQEVSPIRELRSSFDGQIVNIKTYRGTPLVKVGDRVREGDVLVLGYYLFGEEEIECSVIASVTILTESEFEYFSENEGEEDKALIYCEQTLGEEYENYEIEKIQKENGYLYKVKLRVKKEISAT